QIGPRTDRKTDRFWTGFPSAFSWRNRDTEIREASSRNRGHEIGLCLNHVAVTHRGISPRTLSLSPRLVPSAPALPRGTWSESTKPLRHELTRIFFFLSV